MHNIDKDNSQTDKKTQKTLIHKQLCLIIPLEHVLHFHIQIDTMSENTNYDNPYTISNAAFSGGPNLEFFITDKEEDSADIESHNVQGGRGTVQDGRGAVVVPSAPSYDEPPPPYPQVSR